MRGFWVDTFNTTLNNHTDVADVVNRAIAANANTIFAQVRRRGDSWYLNSLEPLADRYADRAWIRSAAGPHSRSARERPRGTRLRDRQRHLEPGAQSLPPGDPNHVFTRHGGYDPSDEHHHSGAG